MNKRNPCCFVALVCFVATGCAETAPIVIPPPPAPIVAPPIDPLYVVTPPPKLEGRRRTAIMRTSAGDQEAGPDGVPNDTLLDEVVLLKDRPCFHVTMRSAAADDQPLSQWDVRVNGKRYYFEQEDVARSVVPYEETTSSKGVVRVGPNGVAADIKGVQVTTGWARPVSRHQVSLRQFEVVTRVSELCVARNAVLDMALARPQRQPAWTESFEFSKD